MMSQTIKINKTNGYKQMSTKGFVWNEDKNWYVSKDFKYKITMRTDVGWGYCNDAGRVVKVEWTTTGYDL